MTLQQLYYFCELARTQHYTKTAKKLGISQPTLSYAISELEKELDVKLFDRVSRNVILNNQGKLFYHHIQQGISSIDAGVKALSEDEIPYSTTLTIGYLSSISTNLLPEFIRLFRQFNTNTSVHLNFTQGISADIEKAFMDGTIDIILSVHQPEFAISHAIYQQPLRLYVPLHHPFAIRKSVSLTEAATEPLILVNTQSGVRAQIDEALSKLNIPARIAFEANSCDVVMRYVSQGHGIAILPASDTVPGYPTRELDISDVNLARTIYLSHMPKLRIPPDMTRALEQVIEEMKINSL